MIAGLPRHRLLLIIYNVAMVATMLAIMVSTGVLTSSRALLAWFIVLVPLLTIIWSVVDIEPRARVMGYWGLAMLMIPISLMGMFGGWGLLYAIGVIFVFGTAWVENGSTQ